MNVKYEIREENETLFVVKINNNREQYLGYLIKGVDDRHHFRKINPFTIIDTNDQMEIMYLIYEIDN